MATTTRSTHASGLAAVNRELGGLHREMLTAGGDDDARMVRVSVLTLVIACVDDAVADSAEELVDTLAADHPARVLIVVADRTAEEAIEADLSLRSSVHRGREQVCAEVVRLRVGGEPALHLGSVVAPLLLADVPVMLWLAGGPPLDQALSPEAADVCERIIVDSDSYADAATALGRLADARRRRPGFPLADLAWTRTELWRERVAQPFDAAELTAMLPGVEEIEVTTVAGERDPAGQSLLMGGWLRGQLQAAGLAAPPVTVGRAEGPAEHAGELAAVRIRCGAGRQRGSVEVRRSGSRLITDVEVEGGHAAVMTTSVENAGMADLVGRTIEDVGLDPVYARALAAVPGS